MVVSLAAFRKSLGLKVNSYLQEARMLYDWFCQNFKAMSMTSNMIGK